MREIPIPGCRCTRPLSLEGAIRESYLAGDTIATIRRRAAHRIDRSLSQLKPEEAAVLVLLQKRLRKTDGAKPASAGRKRP